MGVHMSALPDADLGIPKGGSLPSTAACPGAAAALRRTCRNCKTVSDIRKRWRAHGSGVFVHMHADVDVHARHVTDPRRFGRFDTKPLV